MAMEEDEDTILLGSLGVTSANHEDIERGILAKARNNVENHDEAGGITKAEYPDKSETISCLITSQVKLYNKLKAIEFEIDAVAHSVEHVSNVASSQDSASFDRHDEDRKGRSDKKDDETHNEVSPDGVTLQQALVADRLRSLRRTKAQLEKELSDLCKDGIPKVSKEDLLLESLVREDPRPRKKSKEFQKPGKNREKGQKTVSLSDDADFDATLDATSAGFVETERDELVRKGVLTPFHKLKGFERRLQQPGAPGECSATMEEDKSDDFAAQSVARAAQSISEATKARPTTKLLDSKALPMLDAPTGPFQRLKTPLKLPLSPENDAGKGKVTTRKKKRPLPGQKWRKRISHEENIFKESGIFGILLAYIHR